jgi:hypothetical protein
MDKGGCTVYTTNTIGVAALVHKMLGDGWREWPRPAKAIVVLARDDLRFSVFPGLVADKERRVLLECGGRECPIPHTYSWEAYQKASKTCLKCGRSNVEQWAHPTKNICTKHPK